MSRVDDEPEVDEGGPDDDEKIRDEVLEVEEDDDLDMGDIKAVQE